MLVIEQFERAARRFPERAFVVDERQTLSHREMAARVEKVANALVRAGAGAGLHVGLLTPNHPLGLVAQYGIIKAGCVWVPFNYRNTVADTVRQAISLDVRWVFYHSSLCAHVEAMREGMPDLLGAIPIDAPDGAGPAMMEWAAGFAPGAPLPDRRMDDPVSILSTGGTTGVPKGAVHTNRTYEMNTAGYWAAFDFTAPPVHLVVAPLTHAAGVIHWALSGLGATTVLSPSADPDVVLGLIERHRVTFLFLPPTIIYMLLAHPRLHAYDCSTLKHFAFGAAPMSAEKLREAINRFGPILCHLYGSTETLVMNTVLRPDELADVLVTPAHAGRIASCGREGPFARVEIIDEEGTVLPPGERGEIAIRGGFVMAGYYNEPEKTVATRINGFHRMGDIGVKDADGFLYIVDRKSDMIITGGFNVFPTEIEQVVLAHPAVRDCVVVGVPHPKWGEAVLAAVELKPGCTLDADELIACCKAELGSVKAPKLVEVVDELPRSTVGKVLRRAVRARYWEGHATAP
ncbi:class I adenylate-forming enzyme family protein [Methylobacterium aquaticum]|uniref:Long-chain fatty acid--CoA ligase n=1 Tax=Methylobacterium aquaticum TaxID=270351 RepID=A0A0J6SF81_9HYPH|nr:AMP-binding protein [Methylobacterium aquaticum]KMO32362.1 hypothetical protein VP06_17835 [Methylobacterium aquaticum]